MQYIILHANEEKGTLYITGCFARVAPESEERELFEVLVDCIEDVNNTFYHTENVVKKDNTIYFRHIEANTLFKVLKFWNRNLLLHLSVKLGRNTVYTGKNSRQALENLLSELDLPVIRVAKGEK